MPARNMGIPLGGHSRFQFRGSSFLPDELIFTSNTQPFENDCAKGPKAVLFYTAYIITGISLLNSQLSFKAHFSEENGGRSNEVLL